MWGKGRGQGHPQHVLARLGRAAFVLVVGMGFHWGGGAKDGVHSSSEGISVHEGDPWAPFRRF